MIENSKLGYYLTPILRVWLFMFFLLLCALPFVLLAQMSFLPSLSDGLPKDIVTELSLILVVLGALLMIFRVLPPLNFHDVFLKSEKSLQGFFSGAAVGIILMVLCALVLYLNKNVQFSVGNMPAVIVGQYVLYFFLIALFEELLFRSFPMFALAERYPVWFAVVVNGILFALAHFANPDLSVVGIINITLAGMLFAIVTIQKRNIAWAVGAHFTWNFVQSIILGYNLSGNQFSGIMKAVPTGPDYLSGGKFGLEGSICCTIILIFPIAWLVYRNGLGFNEIEVEKVQEDEES
jgi:uncharacterized protein